jgi:hypothetical protein
MAITLNGTTGITTPALDTSGDVTFADNDKAIFGAGSDLQIYHNGSNSISLMKALELVFYFKAPHKLLCSIQQLVKIILLQTQMALFSFITTTPKNSPPPPRALIVTGTSTTAANGEYTRVGGIVCLTGVLDWSANTSWAVNNYITIIGLPFTALYGGNAVGYSNRTYPTTMNLLNLQVLAHHPSVALYA